MIHTTLAEETNSLGQVVAYVVTTDTGYRAILPACPCDRRPCHLKMGHPMKLENADGDMTRWQRRAALDQARKEHERTHCHRLYGCHRPQAEAFAAAVEKTYPKTKKGRNR